jgi:hypothetical protein
MLVVSTYAESPPSARRAVMKSLLYFCCSTDLELRRSSGWMRFASTVPW